MKKIIVPIIVTFALMIVSSAQAQVTVKEDTLKTEKVKETPKTGKVKVKAKKTNVKQVKNLNKENEQKITITEEGVEADKKKTNKSEGTKEEKPLKGEEKKGTEKNVPKKED